MKNDTNYRSLKFGAGEIILIVQLVAHVYLLALDDSVFKIPVLPMSRRHWLTGMEMAYKTANSVINTILLSQVDMVKLKHCN
jgi:Ni,Fe-hydrogenase I cytochrome b subunit